MNPDDFNGLPYWDDPHQPCGGCNRAHAYWDEKCRTVDEIHEEAMEHARPIGDLVAEAHQKALDRLLQKWTANKQLPPSAVQLTALEDVFKKNYQHQKDCACPNLINGHWFGCIFY